MEFGLVQLSLHYKNSTMRNKNEKKRNETYERNEKFFDGRSKKLEENL